MLFKDFIKMYDNLNGIVVVNNDNLERIVEATCYTIISQYHGLDNKEVVSFGFYDDELTIRVK